MPLSDRHAQRYHQFYNNSYSVCYKIYFCNKNKKNIRKKYIFCFYTSYVRTNRIGTMVENLNEWHI